MDRNEEMKKNLKHLSENDKTLLGNIVIDQLRVRTRGGIGVTPDGREYRLQSRPYDRKYAQKKGSSDVDLTDSGAMLEDMYVKGTTRDTVKISVAEKDFGKLRGTEEGIRRVQKDARGNPILVRGKTVTKDLIKRPWFHLSNGDMDKIVNNKRFQDTFARAIKRATKKKS